MAYLIAFAVSWFSGWLVQRVPTLDPAQAHDVAQAIVGNAWSIALSLVTSGWLLLRRPGDAPAALPDDAKPASRWLPWL